MRSIIVLCISLCTLALTACGAANIPTSSLQMQMSSMKPVSGDDTESTWNVPKNPHANQNVTISIQIEDKHGKLIKKFDTVNTKKMHLIVVNKDLSYFAHIHPVLHSDGTFTITTSFPEGGDYKLIAEMTPSGFPDYSIESHWIHVQGKTPKQHPIAADNVTNKTINGIKVSISFDQTVKAKKNVNMVFTMHDANTNKPIHTLKPYLGAMGHATAIDKDNKIFLHIHPLYATGNGPGVTFMTYFPQKGIYKVWGQFNVNGKLVTAPFIVKVL
ncbi:hypothetical protein [Heyndrickxia acidicola]|uniref:YtkA-like domain-containing protein n=1 Tax=Heyndrickxia acidicola TaxID=209389 RepID=A0ABU6MB70_9BACI|nr:hypothetical protein [Heyndrickxia acidicola]MED1201923.1 hypothetical protein [Heyndrickxia acidicola]